MTSKYSLLTCIAVTALATPALAHHSFAMFDADKILEIHGTVKELRWTNPHSWLFLMVDAEGTTKEWAFEMGAPVGLARTGWRPRTVVAGDKVIVKMHPMRDGTPAGQLLSVTLPNGQTLGDSSSAPN